MSERFAHVRSLSLDIGDLNKPQKRYKLEVNKHILIMEEVTVNHASFRKDLEDTATKITPVSKLINYIKVAAANSDQLTDQM